MVLHRWPHYVKIVKTHSRIYNSLRTTKEVMFALWCPCPITPATPLALVWVSNRATAPGICLEGLRETTKHLSLDSRDLSGAALRLRIREVVRSNLVWDWPPSWTRFFLIPSTQIGRQSLSYSAAASSQILTDLLFFNHPMFRFYDVDILSQ
jgi:hypothetical protein